MRNRPLLYAILTHNYAVLQAITELFFFNPTLCLSSATSSALLIYLDEHSTKYGFILVEKSVTFFIIISETQCKINTPVYAFLFLT